LEYRIRQIQELLSKKDGLRASFHQVRSLVRARRLELRIERDEEWEATPSYERDFQQSVWERTRAATRSWDPLPSPRDRGRPRVGLMVDGVPFFPSDEMRYHGFFRPEIQDTRTAIKRNFLLWQKKCVDEWMEEFYRIIDRGKMADFSEGRNPDIYGDFDETKPDPQVVSRLREKLRIEVRKLDMIVEEFYRFVEIGLQQTDPKEAEKKIPLLIACDERYREISNMRKTAKEDFLSNAVKRDWEILRGLLYDRAFPRKKAGNVLGAVEDLDRILELLEVVERGLKEAKQAEGAYAERKAAAERRIEEIQSRMRDLQRMPELRRVWEPTRERMEGMIRAGIRPHKNTTLLLIQLRASL
jgi:plasmid stabilization system protein ParE